jgi:NAD(P)-dependent dehydrogenase (short-subunit alcohol dehydrogenase family)
MLLKNKVVVITGVGPGMGRTLGRLAAEEGAKVVLAARRKPFLDEVAAEITAKGGERMSARPRNASPWRKPRWNGSAPSMGW